MTERHADRGARAKSTGRLRFYPWPPRLGRRLPPSDMDWKKLVLAAGGAAGLAATLYVLQQQVRDGKERPPSAAQSRATYFGRVWGV